MGFVIVSLFQKMGFFFFAYLFILFGFIRHCLFRLRGRFIAQKVNTSSVLIQSQEDDQIDESLIGKEKSCDFDEEDDESESFLRFRFPTYQEFVEKNGELGSGDTAYTTNDEEVLCVNSNDEIVAKDDVPAIASSGYGSSHPEEIDRPQVRSLETHMMEVVHVGTVEDSPSTNDEEVLGENSNDEIVAKVDMPVIANSDYGFSHPGEIVRPQVLSLATQTMKFDHVGTVEDSPSTNDEKVLCENSNDEFVAKVEVPIIASSGYGSSNCEEIARPQVLSLETPKLKFVHVGTVEDSPVISSEAEVCESSDSINDDSVGDDVRENSENFEVENSEQLSKLASNSMKNVNFLSDDDESLVSDSDSDSMVSSFRSSFIDSISDGFLSDIDFEEAFEVDKWMGFNGEVKLTKEVFTEQDIELQNLSKGYETDEFEDEDEDILDELKNIEESVSNLEGGNKALDQGNGAHLASTSSESKQNGEKPNSEEQLSSDSEEQNELERQWEHQDLVEQLKMEIRKVRAIGLPTILEESESPKIMEDLKPWKIEEKFQHEDTLDELHKFYKSYRERMRKLDILNYQKMYAIGFLRLKDPLQSFARHKFSIPAMANVVSLDCWPCKSISATKIHQPVMKKFSRELESDLEMVYVGQMCLSWEFLHWEYGKALELWDSDPHGVRQYNEVADKFQQFQVLLTRFIEDERFQGPRVQHYVKSRCVLRNLLQVPVIREDNFRDRKKERKLVSSKDAITSIKLVEMLEESIRIFWRFIRADKDTSSAVLVKCRRSSSIELQNPGDANLLAQVRSTLQKKDRKLKELLRSENCILRKLQTHHEDASDHVLYFFSQVDLRLVQRVLNMSRITTEQLVWCSDKLSKINFASRKLLVEPSFLLFPCS